MARIRRQFLQRDDAGLLHLVRGGQGPEPAPRPGRELQALQGRPHLHLQAPRRRVQRRDPDSGAGFRVLVAPADEPGRDQRLPVHHVPIHRERAGVLRRQGGRRQGRRQVDRRQDPASQAQATDAFLPLLPPGPGVRAPQRGLRGQVRGEVRELARHHAVLGALRDHGLRPDRRRDDGEEREVLGTPRTSSSRAASCGSSRTRRRRSTRTRAGSSPARISGAPISSSSRAPPSSRPRWRRGPSTSCST